MPAKYELKKSKNDKVYFNLIAPNGEIVLSSQMYATKSSAQKGIRSVQMHCGEKNCYQSKTAKSGKAHFVLKSKNHRVIGTSQTYKSSASMTSGIKSVMKNGKARRIEDLC